PDADLGQTLPELTFLGRAGLPAGLKHLVGVERPLHGQQPPGLLDRLSRSGRVVVGNPGHSYRAPGKRPAVLVPGTGVPGPARFITVTHLLTPHYGSPRSHCDHAMGSWHFRALFYKIPQDHVWSSFRRAGLADHARPLTRCG